jgi:arylsulfatase A
MQRLQNSIARVGRHPCNSPLFGKTACLCGNRRRNRTFSVAMSLAQIAVPCALAARELPEPPPNIIYILADDLGYAELGCYGQEKIRTPHIDQLAREGMRFTQHYCGNAVCAPSRCCLLTGKHPGHAYIRNNSPPKGLDHLKEKYGWEFPGQIPVPETEVTIAEMLKPKGYTTAAIGKWGLGHVGTSGDPNTQGHDLFFGYNCQAHAHSYYPGHL